MKMTKDLAQRIVARPTSSGTRLTDAQQTEILMDWLAGMPGKEIQAKHNVSKSGASGVIQRARRDAKLLLGRTS